MTETQAIDWESKYRTSGAPGERAPGERAPSDRAPLDRAPWERPAPHPAFLTWRESGLLAPPARVLIPGAGRSAEPVALAEAGFDVTVVDAAPTAVAVQRDRLSPFGATARAEVADLFAWAPEAPFDTIYDQTCLCALPPALWPEYAARLAGWLRPGGRLFILFMQTGQAGGPPFDCDLPAMRALFDASRWDWPETLGPRVPHPSLRDEQPALLTRR